jgi:alpha-amylase/alpha-mannosidase (GH57 family)
MSAGKSVDVVFLWHHHQPDYRRAADGRAELPWVRLHAAKDYLDMALHLERHPSLRAGFNFVPSLLDQLEDAVAGGRDALFDLLARRPADLAPAEREELARRCRTAPRHAYARWGAFRALGERVDRWIAGGCRAPGPSEGELLALSCWFLLAWIDPTFLGEPEAARALARGGAFEPADRDGLLALHARLTAAVLPAYRRLAERGQVELSTSPYCHPILPLLVDVRAARRARPAIPLPSEPFAAPGDARRQIERARARHAAVFGAAPAGLWPSEGSVSPEAASLAAACGVRWIASDEGVLWGSLPEAERRRDRLHRPWRLTSPSGDVAVLFRDRELSDKIGFVYSRWEASAAVKDFMDHVRSIGRGHGGDRPALVSVILDGENCWEHYPDDGGPFLEALYAALESAGDVRTLTPSEALAAHPAEPLPGLHSGSWIDADFHIWIGHPEKNRAWDLIARTRRALAAAGDAAPAAAWDALDRAEGSDWFWWFGEDHFTADKTLFDRLFRDHLRAVHEHLGAAPPRELATPISHRPGDPAALDPIGWVRPVIDGKVTDFYEWHTAGRHAAGSGGAMHEGERLVRDLFHGFDESRLYLRVDFAGDAPPAGTDLVVEMVAPRAASVVVSDVASGTPVVREAREGGGAIAGAECRVDDVLELALPFESLGLATGEEAELVVHLTRAGRAIESHPSAGGLRLTVPGPGYAAEMWSV